VFDREPRDHFGLPVVGIRSRNGPSTLRDPPAQIVFPGRGHQRHAV